MFLFCFLLFFYVWLEFHITPQRVIHIMHYTVLHGTYQPGCVHSNSCQRSSPGGSLMIRITLNIYFFSVLYFIFTTLYFILYIYNIYIIYIRCYTPTPLIHYSRLCDSKLVYTIVCIFSSKYE